MEMRDSQPCGELDVDVRDRERNVADTKVCDLDYRRQCRPSIADMAREKID